MDRKQIFTTPLFVKDFDKHKENKELYLTYIDKCFKNTPVDPLQLYGSKFTNSTLHSVSIFDDLIQLIGNACKQFHKDFEIGLERDIGIRSMYASNSSQGQIIEKQYFNDAFLYGAYFLQTPDNSGRISIQQDITDRNYFGPLAGEKPNLLNTNKFECLIPEGSIFFMPSHLCTSYSANLNTTSDRYIIHFLLKILR